jgi:hypothetical protein
MESTTFVTGRPFAQRDPHRVEESSIPPPALVLTVSVMLAVGVDRRSSIRSAQPTGNDGPIASRPRCIGPVPD